MRSGSEVSDEDGSDSQDSRQDEVARRRANGVVRLRRVLLRSRREGRDGEGGLKGRAGASGRPLPQGKPCRRLDDDVRARRGADAGTAVEYGNPRPGLGRSAARLTVRAVAAPGFQILEGRMAGLGLAPDEVTRLQQPQDEDRNA